jgi:hypothetical protein
MYCLKSTCHTSSEFSNTGAANAAPVRVYAPGQRNTRGSSANSSPERDNHNPSAARVKASTHWRNAMPCSTPVRTMTTSFAGDT